MTNSDFNKLKTNLLSASAVGKSRVCTKLIEEAVVYKIELFPEDQWKQFKELTTKAEFDTAIQYLLDTMLPWLKKNNPGRYPLELTMIDSCLLMTIEFKPNYPELIDKGLNSGNYYGLLKAMHLIINPKYGIKAVGDLLYILEEMHKRPSSEIPPHAKHCVFHLLTQLMTRKKSGDYVRTYIEPYFFYLQIKYQCFDENDPLEQALFQRKVRQNDFKTAWQQFFLPTGEAPKRITLEVVKQAMKDMDLRHAEEVHYLFVCRYIDYNKYEFHDPWMTEFYLGTYWDFYRTGQYLDDLNRFVWDILEEWQQYANHLYQRAKRDLYYWISDPIPEFAPSLGDQIKEAYEAVIGKEDPDLLTQALIPFPIQIADILRAGNYEDAAANIYCIFEYLGAARKDHESWFDSLWVGGDMTKIVLFTETLCELYCHLRQLKDLPQKLKDEMDIHLAILNKKADLFGEMWGDSRFEDMLLDGKKQYGSYSDLEECSMWKHWYSSLAQTRT